MDRVRRFTRISAALLLCMAIIFGCLSLSQAASTGSHVEARISDLRAKLKITDAQEEQWNKLAQVMRENAATMQPLIAERKEKGAMNAVDDLKSYSGITDAQAAGLKNFVAAFEPLYASFSDDQKKLADKIFAHRVEKRLKKKK